MSSSWIRKCVLAAALAVMPVQGIAAALMALICHDGGQTQSMHPAAGHEQGDHAAAQQHEHGPTANGESGGAGNSYHPCCNLTASAPPATTVNAQLPDFPVHAFLPDPLHDLFVPDRPQRPPLA